MSERTTVYSYVSCIGRHQIWLGKQWPSPVFLLKREPSLMDQSIHTAGFTVTESVLPKLLMPWINFRKLSLPTLWCSEAYSSGNLPDINKILICYVHMEDRLIYDNWR